MSGIDELVQANKQYAASFPGPLPGPPKRHVAVLTCMDARVDVFSALGLEIGDAHVIRNAGGIPTPDVLRSLAISQRELGTREVMVMHHTGCGMTDFDDAAFRAELARESGAEPEWDVPGFTDAAADARRCVELVRECPWLPHRAHVRAFVFDVTTGAVTEV